MPKHFLPIGLVLLLVSALYSQRDVSFSTEEYFGGGIGYTSTFLQLKIAEVFPFNSLGSTDTDTGLLGAQGLNFTSDDIDKLTKIALSAKPFISVIIYSPYLNLCYFFIIQ